MWRSGLSFLITAILSLSAVLPERADAQYLERGTASWYGERFQGLETASGEIFDMDQLTAAHRELPFGAEVRVVHLGTGASVSVVINDRGPCIDGRDIDLSMAAARALGIVEEGLAAVLIRPTRTSSPMQSARRRAPAADADHTVSSPARPGSA